MKDRGTVVHSDPQILGGTPVFIGTRVPLRNLIDYLEHGYTLDEFLDAFPSVAREQAVPAPQPAQENLTALGGPPPVAPPPARRRGARLPRRTYHGRERMARHTW